MFRILKVFLCAFASIFVCANLFAEICEDEISKIKLASSAPIEELLPLEQSLYYQGINLKLYPSSFNKHGIAPVLVFNSELIGAHKIRDENKAFEMAKIALEKEEHFNEWERANLATCYISGIGVEKDYDKARDLVFQNYFRVQRLHESSIEELTEMKFVQSSYDLSLFLAYLYYKGYGVEKDEAKCNFIIKNIRDTLTWKNFYIGKFVPYDKEFAIHILKLTSENDPITTEMLYLIYSGQFNPEDKNSEAAKTWELNFEVEFQKNKIVVIQEEIKRIQFTANRSETHIAFEFIKEKLHLGWYWNGSKFIDNPFFNRELAEKIITKNLSTSKIKWRTVFSVEYNRNGDTSSANKYFNLAKEATKSSSELDELERLKLKVIHTRKSNTSPPFWMDTLK